MSTSFKVEVQTDDSGRWYGNAARYWTHEAAQRAAENLFDRWTLVRKYRAVPSDDPPTMPAPFVVQLQRPYGTVIAHHDCVRPQDALARYRLALREVRNEGAVFLLRDGVEIFVDQLKEIVNASV